MAGQQGEQPSAAAHGDVRARTCCNMKVNKQFTCIVLTVIGAMILLMWSLPWPGDLVIFSAAFLCEIVMQSTMYAMFWLYGTRNAWAKMWKVTDLSYIASGVAGSYWMYRTSLAGSMTSIIAIVFRVGLGIYAGTKFKCTSHRVCKHYRNKIKLMNTELLAVRIIGTFGVLLTPVTMTQSTVYAMRYVGSILLALNKINEDSLDRFITDVLPALIVLVAVSVSAQAMLFAIWYAQDIATWRSWKKRVRNAEIAWIKCSTVRAWARNASGKLVRRQEIQCTDFVTENEMYASWFGTCCWCARRSEKRRSFIVSHAWLSKAHPDPDGVHLKEIVEELRKARASDDDVVFVDFCSLYQTDLNHPDAVAILNRGERLPEGHSALRTPHQNEAFQHAMSIMHELYTWYACEVLIVSSVPDNSCNNIPYYNRGWCFFELAISADYWRIANISTEHAAELLNSNGLPLDVQKFESEFQKKVFTNKGDEKIVLALYRKLYESEPGRTARDSWYNVAKYTVIGWASVFLHEICFLVDTK